MVMSRNKFDRHKKEYIEDRPHDKVHDLDCVPQERPYGSWTNGVKAWSRKKGGGADEIVGWFYPPRLRNSPPKYSKRGKRPDFRQAKPLDEKKQRAKKTKQYFRILRSRGYTVREAQAILAGLVDTELNPIVPEFSESDEISNQGEE